MECQFSSWYGFFEKETIKSTTVTLTTDFIDYLKEDGVHIPGNSIYERDELSDDDELREVNNCDEGVPSQYKLPSNIEEQIETVLKSSNRGVFVKTNWSAPIDAAWLFGGSLKCRRVEDILLLLKSSERITFDIEHMFDKCKNSQRKKPDEYTLVIRRWADLLPSMEFRIFIRSNNIVGICQRNCSTYFPYLLAERNKIADIINAFYSSIVKGRFPLSSYVLDVYIDKRNRIWIIDFNVFGEPTSPLLFEWTELLPLAENAQNVEDTITAIDLEDRFRVIESEADVLSSVSATSRGPIDVHMASEFADFMRICKEQQASPDT
eukprot:gene23656-32027_t